MDPQRAESSAESRGRSEGEALEDGGGAPQKEEEPEGYMGSQRVESQFQSGPLEGVKTHRGQEPWRKEEYGEQRRTLEGGGGCPVCDEGSA